MKSLAPAIVLVLLVMPVSEAVEVPPAGISEDAIACGLDGYVGLVCSTTVGLALVACNFLIGAQYCPK